MSIYCNKKNNKLMCTKTKKDMQTSFFCQNVGEQKVNNNFYDLYKGEMGQDMNKIEGENANYECIGQCTRVKNEDLYTLFSSYNFLKKIYTIKGEVKNIDGIEKQTDIYKSHWAREHLIFLSGRSAIKTLKKEGINKHDSFTYCIVRAPNYGFPTKIRQIKCSTEEEWYKYGKDNGGWWVNFANKTLGGGVFGKGFVQEETMLLQIPQALYVAYLLRQEEGKKSGFTRVMEDGESIIIQDVNVTMWWNSKKYYENAKKTEIHLFYYLVNLIEKNVDNTKDKESVQKYLREILTNNYSFKYLKNVKMNMICLDAKDHKKSKGIYTSYDENEIRFLFDKCYAGFAYAKSQGATKINTGRWGSGAFKNDLRMMTLIQIVVARIVGVNLVFWGMIYETGMVENITGRVNSTQLDTINNSITMIHDLYRSIIAQHGGANYWKHKYLKYKNKYNNLYIKNNKNCI